MANVPIYNLTDTWNAGGTTFDAIKMSVTDTASAADSKLLDLLVNGASKFTVTKAGNVQANAFEALYANLDFNAAKNGVHGFGGDGFYVRNSASYAFASTSYGPGAKDTFIYRDGAGQLALRNGTNPQSLHVYNTYTDASNYERGYLDWSSNVMRLGTEKLGSGTARALELQTDGTTAVTLTTAQKAEFAATIKTAAPSGGTAAEWKLGTVASVSPTSPDRTIEVEIGGTTYYLAAKTTND